MIVLVWQDLRGRTILIWPIATCAELHVKKKYNREEDLALIIIFVTPKSTRHRPLTSELLPS